MTQRYGQLSYTCVDGLGNTGGWQVKEKSGDISADEEELLVSRIHLVLNPVEQLSAYPTPDELAATPRRLTYRRVDDGTAAYWHSAAAGRDSIGRPGNVFIHALLDREAAQARFAPRPIELWRSARWLTPYGGEAVSGAGLPVEVPGAGGTICADSVAEFACEAGTSRLGTLCGLLDAVAGALEDAPAVLLVADSTDAAARWIGAVSFLMSPGTARRLNFAIVDSSIDVEHLLTCGYHLVAAPRDELTRAPSGLVVIDDAETLSMGELDGQRHRTAGGQHIEVTPWSVMAQVVLADDGAAQVFCDIDEFASHVIDDGLAPALPMAASVLCRGRWDDAVDEARSVIGATHAPRLRAMDPDVVGKLLPRSQ